MAGSLLDEARKGRTSGAALKVQLAERRSHHPDKFIFVFEGLSDLGPYEAWISRCHDELSYIPLPGRGKSQCLDLLRRLRADETGLARGVYVFVDRDFDGLRELNPGPDVYCTQSYSIESYVVSERVLRSILLDEFRMAADYVLVDRVIERFTCALESFLESVREVNWRLFVRTHLSRSENSIADDIGRHISIDGDLRRCALKALPGKDIVPISSDLIDEAVRRGLESVYRELPVEASCRGKYLLQFFSKWLNALAKARRDALLDIFDEQVAVRLSSGVLEMRSLASRSATPPGLVDFLACVRSV